MIRYGILDDFDEVVRWVWLRPGPGYRYITQRVPRERKPAPPAIDWDSFEPSPF